MCKEVKYKKLVERVKADYKNRKYPTNENAIYVKDCEHDLKRINLWSYWQGNLDAKILVLGQDWGSFIPSDKENEKRKIDRIMDENFKKIDAGENVDYFSGVDERIKSSTDKMLIELFDAIKIDISGKSEPRIPLFFSNLCLGYRNDGYTGGFKMSWLNSDVKYLVGYDEDGEHIDGLLEIIKPKVVICLGKNVYKVVIRALFEKNALKENVNISDFYRLLHEGKNFRNASLKGNDMQIFGMSHPGPLGQANRKSRIKDLYSDVKEMGKELMISDWEKMASMYDENFERLKKNTWCVGIE